MKRLLIFAGVTLIFFVILTQVGWLSTGFYGGRIPAAPPEYGVALIIGAIAGLGALGFLKLYKWWTGQ